MKYEFFAEALRALSSWESDLTKCKAFARMYSVTSRKGFVRPYLFYASRMIAVIACVGRKFHVFKSQKPELRFAYYSLKITKQKLVIQIVQ